MWMTFSFSGTAALFLAMTIAKLGQLRWVRRLMALERITAADRSTWMAAGRARCSVARQGFFQMWGKTPRFA